VLVQTHQPEDPVMKALASGNRDGFLDLEAEDRMRLGLPPFGRLAAVIVSGNDETQVNETARTLRHVAPLRCGGPHLPRCRVCADKHVCVCW
jgi:primosomal protein N' (replication factor Y)